MALPAQAATWGDYQYAATTSLWTTHFNPQPEHNNHQRFMGVERLGENYLTNPLQQRYTLLADSEPMLGLAFFQNSFHQSTIYAYAGFRHNFHATPTWRSYAKITAGFIHGYRGKYQYKIPFNSFGTSPAAIPSLGVQYRAAHAEVVLFGASGIMLTAGFNF